MYAIDVGNWHSVLGMRPLLKGDRKGSPIGTNLSGPRPTPRLTARVNPTLRRISHPSSWRRSAGLASVLGWCGQPSLNPEVGAHGRAFRVARGWGWDPVPPRWEPGEQDAGDHEGPPHHP